MFITLIHLACDVLTRLIALDEGDGLLNFRTIFQPIPRDYEGSNAPLIIAVVLCGGVLQFLVGQSLCERRRGSMTNISSSDKDQTHNNPCPRHMSRSLMPRRNPASRLRLRILRTSRRSNTICQRLFPTPKDKTLTSQSPPQHHLRSLLLRCFWTLQLAGIGCIGVIHLDCNR
jgi:hypothetical protein